MDSNAPNRVRISNLDFPKLSSIDCSSFRTRGNSPVIQSKPMIQPVQAIKRSTKRTHIDSGYATSKTRAINRNPDMSDKTYIAVLRNTASWYPFSPWWAINTTTKATSGKSNPSNWRSPKSMESLGASWPSNLVTNQADKSAVNKIPASIMTMGLRQSCVQFRSSSIMR